MRRWTLIALLLATMALTGCGAKELHSDALSLNGSALHFYSWPETVQMLNGDHSEEAESEH